MNYISITKSDVNNGLGCRVTLWIAGCTHKCFGCHNPHTHDFAAGKEYTSEVQNVLFFEVDKPYIQGLTLSGGDPVDSLEGTIRVCKDFKDRFGTSKDIWLYTGYTKEELEQKWPDVANYVDYLVDGRFNLAKRDITLAFRGSTNQRIWKSIDGVYHDVTAELD